MRDDNMPVEEVARQIETVAMAVKQGSAVSDMRHHEFSGKLEGPEVRSWHQQQIHQALPSNCNKLGSLRQLQVFSTSDRKCLAAMPSPPASAGCILPDVLESDLLVYTSTMASSVSCRWCTSVPISEGLVTMSMTAGTGATVMALAGQSWLLTSQWLMFQAITSPCSDR